MAGNPNGKKGAEFERLIADHFRDEVDDRIDRRVKTGSKDRGDLANLRCRGERVVVEIKRVARLDLSGWVEEARIEAGNDDAVIGVVIHKRRGKGKPGDQYVTMTVDDLVWLLVGNTNFGHGRDV